MSTAPSPPPPSKNPTNIFELKETVKKILADLPTILTSNDDIKTMTESVATFFSTGYTASKNSDIKTNEKNITEIEKYYTRSNTYIDSCSVYVDKAKAIFYDLDSSISSKIIVDEDFYTEIEKEIPNLLKDTIAAINTLKFAEPVAGSGGTALTDEQKETNTHLEALTTFLKEMMEQLIASIKQNIETEFSDAKIKKMVESVPDDFKQNLTDKVNTICKNILQDVDKKEGEFMALLDEKSSINVSDKIILDAKSITAPFGELMTSLRKIFAENGSNDKFYKAVDPFYFKKIQALIDKINPEVVALGDIPLTPDDSTVVSPGGGGGGNGDGNASTFMAYPVSNKSHKNRNNGNGNSRGKGKGKGKSKNRKPNATKKNNRH
jgi:hypothetical protein